MSYRTPPQVQAQKEARKRLILDTAAQLFAKDGFHNTSVKDIVDACKASLYR